MTLDFQNTLKRFVEKNKPLLLLLGVGLALILMPGSDGTTKQPNEASDGELRLQGALESMTGVGDAYVLLAEANGRNGGYTGAVIVCQGADSPEIRLRIVEAVSAYTGLGSNRILVSKMKNAGRSQQ